MQVCEHCNLTFRGVNGEIMSECPLCGGPVDPPVIDLVYLHEMDREDAYVKLLAVGMVSLPIQLRVPHQRAGVGKC